LSSLSHYVPRPESGRALRLVSSAGALQQEVDAWRAPFVVIVLCYLLLPSLPSLLCIYTLGALRHGFVNLEILAVGAVAAFLPRWAVFLLLLADLLADCAYSICYTYQFSLSDLFESARFLGALPLSRLMAGWGVAALAILLCCVLALLRPRPESRVRPVWAFLALVFILLPIDMLGGQNPLWHQDVSLLSGRVTRSPILTLGVRALLARRTELRATRTDIEPMASASAQMTSWLNALPAGAVHPNVVLVVVESWGLPLDARLAQALLAPYDSAAIARSYRVTYGDAPFTGLTVPGEARELCHSTMGFGILHTSATTAQQCLPSQFHGLGYENVAIHGYVGEMFYRAAWYPELGFDRTWFGPELRRMGLPGCDGAFPGVCDGAIARFIGGSLLNDGQARPKFIYWVTLNSHLPVPAQPSLPADNWCAAEPALRDSAALCSWFRLVRTVHESVSQIAARTTRPTVFILVGDHAPPFGEARLRNQLSTTQVPYVMLTPLSVPMR
jgi:Sulfatase